MAVNSDYYSMLGIDKSASADDIKRAYRKLALQYHPDRNKTKEAEEKFKEINRAYEVLGDPQKRQMYDQFGTAAFEGQAGPSAGPFGGSGQYGPFTYTYTTGGNGADFDFGGFSDPFDIFEQFFGGGFRQTRRQVYSLVITFNEAVHGTQKEVTIDSKKQTIMIPAGVDSGSRIRFADYDVVIDVIPDKHFKREGVDVITEEEITFPQAVLGTQLQVKTIDDNVKLRIPPGTQHGTLIRLSGKGFQRLRSTGHGDHYVKIKIIVPKNPNKRQKELLEEFDTLSGNKKWF